MVSAGDAIARKSANPAPLNIVAPGGQTDAAQQGQAKAVPYGWIINPVIDVVFCCGGLLWLMYFANSLAIKYLSGADATFALVAIAGTHILSETHTAATLERLHQSEATRKALSKVGLISALLCVLLAVASLIIPGVAAIYVKIYLLWIVQHFMAQTYGISLIYCYKRNYLLSLWEKRILKFAVDATIAYGIARQLTFREWSVDSFVGQSIPFWGPLPMPIFTAIDCIFKLSIISFAVMIGLKFLRERKIFPLPAALLTVSGIAIFSVPRDMTTNLWVYVPAFYHGCQYLVVSTSYMLKERGLPENVSTAQLSTLLLKPSSLKYFATLFVVGVFIYGGMPGLLQDFGFDFKIAYATVFTVINFHHFFIDAAIWRLRDPHVRKLLIS